MIELSKTLSYNSRTSGMKSESSNKKGKVFALLSFYLKQLLLTFLICVSLVIIYLMFWSIQHNFTASPAKRIDLRKSAAEAPYCISFCASLADNPIGFPGHAYVVWSESVQPNLSKDPSLGFMPRHFNDQLASLFIQVPGILLDKSKGNDRKLDVLTVLVSKEEYSRSLELASGWRSDKFKAGERDCVAFVNSVANSLGLQSKAGQYIYPQDYLRSLKELN